MKILIATSNIGKFTEIKELLSDLPLFTFLSLSDMPTEILPPEETGKTFAENALQKAQYYFEKTGIPTLAEDSGIEVDALAGELGIKTRRWGAGEKASDEEWMQFFLERMQHESNKNARFFCTSCLLLPHTPPLFFEGSAEGVILQTSSVPLQKGIPLSSYFLPNGHDTVFAALTPEQKNSISHRGKAIVQVKEYLGNYTL